MLMVMKKKIIHERSEWMIRNKKHSRAKRVNDKKEKEEEDHSRAKRFNDKKEKEEEEEEEEEDHSLVNDKKKEEVGTTSTTSTITTIIIIIIIYDFRNMGRILHIQIMEIKLHLLWRRN